MKGRGFTLVEFVIYSVIVTIVIGALTLITIDILKARAKIFAMEEVNHNAKFVLEKITKEIREAQQIVNATSSYLKLIDADGDIVEFKLEDGIIKMRRGDSDFEFFPLSTDSVFVKSLDFTNVSYPNTPGTIRIVMTIKFKNPQARPEWEFERTFYTSENVRK
jgi:cell division protein FtsL